MLEAPNSTAAQRIELTIIAVRMIQFLVQAEYLLDVSISPPTVRCLSKETKNASHGLGQG